MPEDYCDHTLGFVSVELTDGEVAYDYGSPVVTVTYPSGDDIDYAVEAGGHLEFQVAYGSYILQAADEIGGCFTEEPTSLEVEQCGEHEVELVMSLCWG